MQQLRARNGCTLVMGLYTSFGYVRLQATISALSCTEYVFIYFNNSARSHAKPNSADNATKLKGSLIQKTKKKTKKKKTPNTKHKREKKEDQNKKKGSKRLVK